jgi:hypothetical protein
MPLLTAVVADIPDQRLRAITGPSSSVLMQREFCSKWLLPGIYDADGEALLRTC